MNRLFVLAVCGMVTLAGCATSSGPTMGADGRPLPTVYKIPKSDFAKLPGRVQEGINTLRQARGLSPLQLNNELFMAASAHSNDMSKQNRPWHFGSDGSSPVLRVQRAGYRGGFVGELVSESFETEMEVLADWTGDQDTRNILLDPTANEMGFSWWQDPNGKLWWTLITGNSAGHPISNLTITALGKTVDSEVDGIPSQ